MPEFIRDVTGNIPGWPFADVSRQPEPTVWIVNGSGYGFAITVQPEDSVAYADLVETVDTAMGEKLRNVTVAPAN